MIEVEATAEQDNMRTVILPLKSSELCTQMAAMRVWLDDRRFEPSSFTCLDNSAGVLVHVDFKAEAEAEAFARQFSGRGDEALAAAETVLERARFRSR